MAVRHSAVMNGIIANIFNFLNSACKIIKEDSNQSES